MLILPILSKPFFLRNEKLENGAQLYRHCHSPIFIFKHLKNNELYKNAYENLVYFLNIIMLSPVGGEVNLWLSRSIILKYTIEHFRSWAPKLHLIIQLKKKMSECKLCCLHIQKISQTIFHYCFFIATKRAKNRTFI